MRIDPPFPESRRQDPARQAEWRVYQRLERSDLAGRALYEVQIGQRSRELDFLVFLEQAGRIGIEVKGGWYRLRDGAWQLRTSDGWRWKPSPLTQIAGAVSALQDAIAGQLGRSVPVMPVLVFPDMRSDRDVENLAGTSDIHVMWGLGRFVERLVALAEVCAPLDAPAPAEWEAEVEAITSWREVGHSGPPDGHLGMTSGGMTSGDMAR